MKVCTKCRQGKPLTDFHRRRSHRDGLQPWCKACRCANAAAWRTANPERARETDSAWLAANKETRRASQRAWEAANRERVRETKARWAAANREKVRQRHRLVEQSRRAQRRQSEGTLTLDEWEAICEAAGHRCLACGQTDSLSIDHVIPLARGGEHARHNIQPLCLPCNAAKSTATTDYRPGGWPYRLQGAA